MSSKELYNYFHIKCSSFDVYSQQIEKLLEQKIPVLCKNTENVFYTFNNWLSEYLFQYKNERDIKTTYEIKNYSTFDLKVKIKITDSYIIFEPYNSAVDRYVIFEILYPFIKTKNVLHQVKNKLIIIKNIERISLKHHKYLAYLLKTYYSVCTFLFTTNNPNCVSDDILKNIYIVDIPITLDENINLFWEKNNCNRLQWHKLLDNLFDIFFVQKRNKGKDLKILRNEISNLYTSNVPVKEVIKYIYSNLENYAFSPDVYTDIFLKISEIEYYLQIGNRYILHLEYLFLYLQNKLNV